MQRVARVIQHPIVVKRKKERGRERNALANVIINQQRKNEMSRYCLLLRNAFTTAIILSLLPSEGCEASPPFQTLQEKILQFHRFSMSHTHKSPQRDRTSYACSLSAITHTFLPLYAIFNGKMISGTPLASSSSISLACDEIGDKFFIRVRVVCVCVSVCILAGTRA
jgi:hypothetical protein